MRRTIALLTLLLLVTVTTWTRSERVLIQPDKTLTFQPLPLPPRHILAAHLGPFQLEGAWQVKLGSWLFGGYSALLPLPDGRLLAISDGGRYLAFAPPGSGRRAKPRFGVFLKQPMGNKSAVDIESAARDPRSGTLWLGLEGENAIVRMTPRWVERRRVKPPAMSGWGLNSGAEAMARLRDGRFVVLREAPQQWWRARRHEGLIFAGDPTRKPKAVRRFVFDGPANFDPVDMVQLPDGRMLVLMRTLAWPAPQRFAGRLAIGNVEGIAPGATWRVREVARIASSLPIDNFEAMAVTPRADGRLTVWLMSDDNQARLQRTVLWKLAVDPAVLPR